MGCAQLEQLSDALADYHDPEPPAEVVEMVRVVCQLVAMFGSNDSMLVRQLRRKLPSLLAS